MKYPRLYAHILSALFLAPCAARAVNVPYIPAEMTYQGRLLENGVPVNGQRDIRITFCDAPTSGVCHNAAAQTVNVSSGVFKTIFTPNTSFNIDAGPWYLEVTAGAAGSGGTTTLAPRELLTSSSYAGLAGSAIYATSLKPLPGGVGVVIATSVAINHYQPPMALLHISSESANNTDMLMLISTGGASTPLQEIMKVKGDGFVSAKFLQVSGGKLMTSGPVPVLFSGCIGGTVVGNDIAGRLSSGGGGNCQINFAIPWPNPPVCVLNQESAGAVYTTSTNTSFTIVGVGAANFVGYHCIGY